jgi:phenylalanyl-tRNA synthetase beta chain
MKVSFNWLRELVELRPGVTADSVAEKLTLAGLEVESIERRGRDVRGVVVAEVRGARPHPMAERLSLVRVSAGGAEAEVVCGASNVPPPGGKVAWAEPGAVLPGGTKIERREIRGFSSPGMICSEVELGLGEQGDGILILSPAATPGADLMSHLGVLDEVLHVNVTPNRPDALSHAGIAREVAALYGTRWRLPPPDVVPTAAFPVGRAVDVEIRDPQGCPRYAARVVTDVKIAPSPLALRVRLAACGVRAISNVVDATSYVMLETGHPLLAFDLDRLSGGISVRRAARGERMTTLDGVDRALQESDLVIADGRGPVALAGVMGGASSGVGLGTTAVLLEAAAFDPRAVRRTTRHLGLRSEASHRFARGVDPNGVPHASLRGATMIARLGGGALAGDVIDRYPQHQHPRRVTLSAAGLERLAGFPIPLATAAERLQAIEIETERAGEAELVATVPTFRADVAIEEDLVEEVMRLHGYDRAPARLPAGGRAPGESPEALADRARDLLAAQGLHEVVTWGFVPRAWLQALVGGRKNLPLGDGVVVKNPISADHELMRTSLLPGLLAAARRNLERGMPDVALFEVGPVVLRAPDPKEPPLEPTTAAAVLVGRRPGWLTSGEPVDFFDAKRIVDELLAGLGVRAPVYAPADADGLFHPGVGAEILAGPSRLVGAVGQIHPKLAHTLGVDAPVFYLEVPLDVVAGERRPVRGVAPPRFPAVTRDICFWIDETVSADAQRGAFLGAAEPLLRELSVLEDFRDPKRARPGKKRMRWSIAYRAEDRALTDADADAAHGRTVAALQAALAVEIRE